MNDGAEPIFSNVYSTICLTITSIIIIKMHRRALSFSKSTQPCAAAKKGKHRKKPDEHISVFTYVIALRKIFFSSVTKTEA